MDKEKQVNPDETISGEEELASAEGESNDAENVSEETTSVSTSSEAESLKDLINRETGRSYKTDEEALKGIKNTYKHVGKVKTENSKELISRLEQMEQELWFAKHSDLEQFKPSILEMRKSGESLDDVLKKDAFKAIYEPAKNYAEIQKSKSVLETNPRLGFAKDKIKEANENMAKYNEAVRTGDATAANQHLQSAQSNAVEGVIEAYNLR